MGYCSCWCAQEEVVSCVHVCACVGDVKTKTRARGSTRRVSSCCDTTREAVIVDRVDHFLYFGTIIL